MVTAHDLAKALEALRYLATLSDRDLPEHLHYAELLRSKIAIQVALNGLNVEVKNA